MKIDVSSGFYSSKKIPLWLVHLLMLLSTVVVSSSFTVGAAITRSLDPAVLLLVRYILALLFLAPFYVAKHALSRPTIRQLGGYMTISISTVGFFWCMFESLRYTTALNTSMIFTLVPGISGLYSMIFLKERLGRYRVFALVLGLVGALWVIFRGDISQLVAMNINSGDVLFLLGCFLMAAYTPLVKKVHTSESMVFMTFWVLFCGAVLLLLISLPKLATVDWPGLEMSVWLGIVYLALFSTVVTFYLTNLATLYLGPTRVMAYSYFYPAFVVLINWSFGISLPPAIVLPGVIIVSISTIVIQRGAAEQMALSKSRQEQQ
nr:DMT family transporter [Desulfobulbaceae bacterium]